VPRARTCSARLERADGTTQTVRLTPEQTSFVVQAAPSALEVSKTYFVLGVEHILLGVDHLLFVAGAAVPVGNWKQLVGTVTAFTVAHSITLAGATLGWVHAPQAPIEATIALSVMFVAAEILHRAQAAAAWPPARPGWSRSCSGCCTASGFPGALREVGLPEQDIPLALLFFNVGVEVGQLLFIAAVVLVLSTLTRLLRRPGPHRARALAFRGAWSACPSPM